LRQATLLFVVPLAGRVESHVQRRWLRFGALGALLASAGLVVVAASGIRSVPVSAAGEYTIDVLPTGFNPELCQVNRVNSTVRWRNKTNAPVRIQVLDLGGVDNPPMDVTEDIAPNATSQGSFFATANLDRTYQDKYLPSRRGRIVAPVDPNFGSQCSPLPPTPTPTPTRTPTPVPTPTQRPPACTGLLPVTRQVIVGCGIAANIAKQGDDE
jgi:hypothetical protein